MYVISEQFRYHCKNHRGHFIMFSVITNIYNKKTKGPTLKELFTATGKLKKFFFYNWKCSMCPPQVTQHTSIRYSSSCYVCQHGCIDILHCCNDLCRSQMVLSVGGSFAYFARNARCTVTTDLLVWYSNAQNDFFPRAAIFSLHTLALPSGRNMNYGVKHLLGKKYFELFLLSVQVS
jgi:hypothetical protein